MTTKIKILLYSLLFFVVTNHLQGTFTSINSTQLTTILQNNTRPASTFLPSVTFPFFIQKATFGGVDVTSKVQYHAARGILYIPNDNTQKMIQFTIYDQSNLTKSYNYQFSCTSYSLQNYTRTDDVTYSDFQSIEGGLMILLNNINRNNPYTYPTTPGSTRNTLSALGIRTNNVTSYMQTNYGNKGKVPVQSDLIPVHSSKTSYKLKFTLTIDGRSLSFKTDFSN